MKWLTLLLLIAASVVVYGQEKDNPVVNFPEMRWKGNDSVKFEMKTTAGWVLVDSLTCAGFRKLGTDLEHRGNMRKYEGDKLISKGDPIMGYEFLADADSLYANSYMYGILYSYCYKPGDKSDRTLEMRKRFSEAFIKVEKSFKNNKSRWRAKKMFNSEQITF